jgi:hypothetical protein
MGGIKMIARASLTACGDELMHMDPVIDRGKLDQNGGDFALLLFTLKQR